MGIGINDFRAMMGKYNLGELVVKTDKSGVKSLAKVNNARYFVKLRATADDVEKNKEVRRAFFDSINSYLTTSGIGNAGTTFINELRQELLGEANVGRKLSRQGDVARILDRLDHGLATGNFDARQGNALVANKALTNRVIKKSGFENDAWRQQAFKRIVTRAQQLLAPPRGQQFNDELMKFISMRADCSVERVSTFLASRQATILDKATVLLPHVKFGEHGWNDDSAQAYVNRHIEGLAWQCIADAVRELHLETKQYAAIAKLPQEKQEVAHVLLGTSAFPVGRMAGNGEFKGLLNAFARLADGTSRTAKARLLGTDVSFAFEGSRLTATVGGATMYVADADVLLERTMKEIGAAKAGECSPATIEGLFDVNSSLLRANGDEAKVNARTAQVAKWYLSSAAKITEVELQGLKDEDLRALATDFKGKRISLAVLKERIMQASEKHMYSPDMLETMQRYGDATDNVVTFGERFNAGAPRPDPLAALAADLFCSEDVWLHDQDPNKSGLRLKTMLLAHRDAVDQLMQDDTKIKDLGKRLPGEIDVSAPLTALKELLTDVGYKPGDRFDVAVMNLDLGHLGAIERQIDELVNGAMDSLQTEFAQLQGGGPVRREAPELWTQTLDEIVQGMKKSGDTKEGRFLALVMNSYLTSAPISEKRAMIASALRLAPDDARQDVKFGALLKGAGPVFQKILQGVSEGEIPPGLQGVFKDMKSNLAPIPKKAVNAMLRKLVADSKGGIASIEVKDTLGSASVGQAFLCKIRFTDGKNKDCVVKMLKPDVQNRFARERPILEAMAREVDGGQEGLMFKRLTARLETIQDELNFGAEVRNLRNGDAAYNDVKSTHKTISSNKSLDGVGSEMNCLALELVEGDPVDKFLSQKVDVEVAEILAGTDRKGSLYMSPNMDGYVDRRERLAKVLGDLGKCQEQLMELAKLWFDTAVFGSGYFHGDLHAGNIMIGPERDKATVIDFGNAMTIGEADRKHLEKLVCSAAARDAAEFVKEYGEIVPADQKTRFAGRKEAFSASLADVFAKGELNDTGTRLAIAMDLFEREGFSAPKSVYNFIQSQMRLQNAIEDVGLKIRQVTGLYELQAPANPFAFRHSDHREDGWGEPLAKMFNPYYPLLGASKDGSGGTFGYELVKYLPGGLLQNSFNWGNTRDAFLDCFKASGTKTDQVACGELIDVINDHVVPLHRSLASVKVKDGDPLDVRIDNLVNAWNHAQRDTLDSAKAAARTLLDGLWEVQQDASKGLASYEPPAVREYGEAVQDVITDRVNAMKTSELVSFAINIGRTVAQKLLAEDDRQQAIDSASENLAAIRKRGFGNAEGLDAFEPCGITNTDHWNIFLDSAKKFVFSPEVRKKLTEMQKTLAKNENAAVSMTEEERLAFAKSWLVNVKMLYKTAVVTQNIPGAVCLDQSIGDLVNQLNRDANPDETEGQNPYVIEDGLIKSKDGQYTFDEFKTLGKKTASGLTYEDYERENKGFFLQVGVLDILHRGDGKPISDQISAPIYLFRALYAQGFLNGLMKVGGLLNSLRDIDESLLADSLVLTDKEIDELARQAFEAQHPDKGECRHPLEFYRDVIAENYARDVMAMFRRSVSCLA